MEKKLYLTLTATGCLCLAGVSYGLLSTYRQQEQLKVQVAALQQTACSSDAIPLACGAHGGHEKMSWSNLQAQLKNSVVQIIVQVAQFNWLEPYKTPNQGQSAGTGFFIDEKGYIITNAHVINQATAISIQVPEFGKELLDAEIVGVAPERDLALLRLKPTAIKKFHEQLGAIPFLSFGDSNTVRRADEVMTLGYPLGQQGLKSTSGVVSGRENEIGRNMIQIDAPINPGNSGGPAIDCSGKVIGINTAGIMSAQNVGYIIPINELKLIIADLYAAEDKLLRKPYLGLFLNAGSAALTEFLHNPHPGGYYVTSIYPQGLADKAGMKAGDMIYSIDGHRVDMYGQINLSWSEDKVSFADYVSSIPSGSEIELGFYRDGKKQSTTFNFDHSKLPPVRVVYPEFEPVEYEVFAGMVIMELRRNHLPLLINEAPELIVFEDPRNQLESTVIVTHVLPDSVAQRSRLISAGQRISELNGISVKTIADVRKAIEKSVTNDFVRIKMSNNFFAVFPLEQILEDEMRLSPIYHYPLSTTVSKIIQMKSYHAQQENKA